MALPNGIHIGTSGWNYEGWRGNFYPKKLSGERMLEAYAENFGTVEVNGTFYNLPETKTVREWARIVPDDFVFSVKASRFITHMKKLKEPDEPLDNLYRVLEPFGEKLGPVLFQLPPSWNVDTQRLEQFLGHLSQDFRYTFEFRDESWHCDEVYQLLEEHDAAFCFYDYETDQTPRRHTADFAYIRLHGPEKHAYKGSYDDATLSVVLWLIMMVVYSPIIGWGVFGFGAQELPLDAPLHLGPALWYMITPRHPLVLRNHCRLDEQAVASFREDRLVGLHFSWGVHLRMHRAVKAWPPCGTTSIRRRQAFAREDSTIRRWPSQAKTPQS